MRTNISDENPFRSTRRLEHAYCWEKIKVYSEKNGPPHLLDFGTFNGAMIIELCRSGIVSHAVGVDVNSGAVSSLQEHDARMSLMSINKGQKLPFQDASFEVVTLIGVLEHVHRQDLLLQELRRVLSDQGRLLVSVPGQHIFSFMDLGNLKFRFPRVHRWYYTRKHSSEQYTRRYVAGENRLIGDIEVEKRWHEHFSRQQLNQLLRGYGFEVLDADGFGFFMRPLHNLWMLSPILKGRLYGVMLSDMRLFSSAELFVECRKAIPASGSE